jgi:hypothetical protein
MIRDGGLSLTFHPLRFAFVPSDHRRSIVLAYTRSLNFARGFLCVFDVSRSNSTARRTFRIWLADRNAISPSYHHLCVCCWLILIPPPSPLRWRSFLALDSFLPRKSCFLLHSHKTKINPDLVWRNISVKENRAAHSPESNQNIIVIASQSSQVFVLFN